MRKFVIITIVAMFAAVSGYGIYASQQFETMSDLMLTNVEALADGGETNTTWDCEGWWGDCSAFCGLCNTKVEGDGSIKGSHTCNNVNKP